MSVDGGGGGGGGSKIPTFIGDDALKGIVWQKNIKTHMASVQRSTINLTLQSQQDVIASAFPAHSKTERCYLDLTKNDLLVDLYLHERALWFVGAGDANKIADRAARLLQHLTLTDLERAPASILKLFVEYREQYYRANPTKTTIVKTLDADNNLVHRYQTPEEQAKADSYATAVNHGASDKFVLVDADVTTTQHTAAHRLLADSIPAYFPRLKARVIKHESRTAHGSAYVTFIDYVTDLITAEFCEPTAADHAKFSDLVPTRGQTIADYLAVHSALYELCMRKPQITEEQIKLKLVNSFALISKELKISVNQYITSFPHGEEPTLQEIKDFASKAYKLLTDQDTSNAAHRATNSSSSRSVTPTSSSRGYSTSPPRRSNSPAAPRSSFGNARQIHFAALADSSQPDYHPCDVCGRYHPPPCYILHPRLADRSPSWQPPTDPTLRAIYEATCKRDNIVPRGSQSSTSTHSQPSTSHGHTTTTIYPNRPARSNPNYRSTTLKPAIKPTTTTYNRAPPPGFTRPQGHTSHLAAAAAAAATSADVHTETADDDVANDSHSAASWHGVEGAVLFTEGHSAEEASSAMAVTRLRAAESSVPAAAPAADAVPAAANNLPSAATIITPVSPRPSPAADSAADVPPTTTSTPPAIQRRPPVVPFGTTPVSRNIPPTQLPNPSRRTRMPIVDYRGAPAIPTITASMPTVADMDDTSLTASLTYLMNSPGLLERYLSESPFLLVSNLNGDTYRAPLSCIRVPLTAELMTDLLNHNAAPAAPAADAAAAFAGTPTLDSLWSHPAALSSATSMLTDSDDETYMDSATPDLIPVSPEHSPRSETLLTADDRYRVYNLAPYTTPSKIVMLHPAVYTLMRNCPARSVSIVCAITNRVLCCPLTIVDTGSNMIIITLKLAHALNLTWTSDHIMHTATSSGDVTATIGKVTTPVNLVICHSTKDEMSVRLPIHIMAGEHDTFEMLLGSPFLNAVGADLSSLRSSFTYCPNLQSMGDTSTTATIRMYTTTTNPSRNYRHDLENPTPTMGEG